MDLTAFNSRSGLCPRELPGIFKQVSDQDLDQAPIGLHSHLRGYDEICRPPGISSSELLRLTFSQALRSMVSLGAPPG